VLIVLALAIFGWGGQKVGQRTLGDGAACGTTMALLGDEDR
jgi:hypothetical protein